MPPTLDEALNDVEARFLFNLPESELAQADRLFFQIEQAFWFYEDFKADVHSNLPHFKNLKSFAEKVFNHCSLLSKMTEKFKELFSDFANYKAKIPVCGCLILNTKMNKVLLVRDWNGNSWMFPRGKINESESEFSCALRETMEEIGYDPSKHCKGEEDSLVVFQDGKKIKLYIATNVPENIAFAPKTRKEISKVEFHHLDFLPKTMYGVQPFMPKLRRWISIKAKSINQSIKSPKPTPPRPLHPSSTLNNNASNSKAKQTRPRANSTGKIGSLSTSAQAVSQHYSTSVVASPCSSGRASRNKGTGSNSFDLKNSDTFADPSGAAGGSAGWSITDMFNANSKITGLSYEYNGNPHDFGSSHPKYINYNSVSSTTSPQLRGRAGPILPPGAAEVEFEQLVQQSMVAYEMMQQDREQGLPPSLSPINLPPAVSLPKSASMPAISSSDQYTKTTIPIATTRSTTSSKREKSGIKVLERMPIGGGGGGDGTVSSRRTVGAAPILFPSMSMKKIRSRWFTTAFDATTREEVMGAVDKVLARTQVLVC